MLTDGVVDPHIDWSSIDMHHLDIGTASTVAVISMQTLYVTYVFPKMSVKELGMCTACAAVQ